MFGALRHVYDLNSPNIVTTRLPYALGAVEGIFRIPTAIVLSGLIIAAAIKLVILAIGAR